MSMPPQEEPNPDGQQGRRRRRRTEVAIGLAGAVAVGVAVVAAIVGGLGGQKATTSDRVGLVGLAPEGATPSTPGKGELVLDFGFGHSMGDHGRFQVSLYADGRLIWQRLGVVGGAAEYGKDYATGWLEQRLTREGVARVKAEAISSGLFDHDLHLQSGQGLYFGHVYVRNGDRIVHVTWGDVGDPYSDVAREGPTPEQASALKRLDARLADPTSWLPSSAWEDPGIKPYVPSGYSVCYQGGQGVGLSRVLALLPPAAEDVLRSRDRTRGEYTNLVGSFAYWCSDLTNEEARSLAGILDAAGLHGAEDVFGLAYGVREPGPTEFSLDFMPLLPHEAKPSGVPKVDYTIDLKTGVMTPLPAAILRSVAEPGPPTNWVPRYAASADGSLLAYVGIGDDESQQIFTAAIDGAGLRQVTHDPRGATSPAWSRDGTRIAYVGHGSGNVQNLFVLDLAKGDTKQITDGARDLGAPQFTPDGSSLLYTCCGGPQPLLLTVPVAGGKSTLLFGRGRGGLRAAANGSPSPDGSLVTMRGDEPGGPGALRFVANVDGTGRRVVPGCYASNPAGTWSPDGGRIVCVGEAETDIVVVDIATGDTSHVATGRVAIWLDDHTLLVEAGDR